MIQNSEAKLIQIQIIGFHLIFPLKRHLVSLSFFFFFFYHLFLSLPSQENLNIKAQMKVMNESNHESLNRWMLMWPLGSCSFKVTVIFFLVGRAFFFFVSNAAPPFLNLRQPIQENGIKEDSRILVVKKTSFPCLIVAWACDDAKGKKKEKKKKKKKGKRKNETSFTGNLQLSSPLD